MKTILTLILVFAVYVHLLAQAPLKMSYQAVVRNTSGELVTNQAVGMKVSILQGSSTGLVSYSETYSPKPLTNANGLVTVEIGNGVPETGTFAEIDWASGPFFLKVETDMQGGTAYQVTGTSQLMSVPFAFYAEKAGNGFSGSYIDLTDKPALFDGTWTSLTGKPTLATVATSGSYADLLDKPTLFDGTWTSLTGKPTLETVATSGSFSDLLNIPALFDGTWNSLTGKPVTIAGFGITDGMSTSHPSNSITSTMMTNWTTAFGWGNHAGMYKSLSYLPAWSELSGIPSGFADGVDHVDDDDNSLTNEIQVLSLAGNDLSLSKEGGTVTIPGDNWGTQIIVTDATLSGSGTVTAPLQIARQTAIEGQVLKWNGSAWIPSDDDTTSVLNLILPYKGRSASEDFLFHMINDGQGGGIRGETIGNTGLLGLASGTLAANIGTAGQSPSPSGVGIWGNNIALTGNGIAVKGSVQSSTGYAGFFERGRFYVEGNTGIGTLNPSAKLEVAGHVKITGGSPGTGKVLTSDASGLGSWETPPAGPFISSGGITSNLPLTDNFVFGSSSVDNMAGSGDDKRMFFLKNKGAFRAGYVFDTSWDNDSVGLYSVAMGQHSKALSSNSIAMGLNVVALADGAIALGNSAAAKGRFSTAIGTGTTSTGIYSLSLGHYSEAKAYGTTAIGRFNAGAGNPDTWVETDPVFEIGIGNGSASQFRRNAVTVLKNGNVGIGPDNPTVKLEVDGQVKITGGSPGSGKVLTSDAAGLASWQTPAVNPWQTSGSNIYYSGGNAGIGTSSPAALLHVEGTGTGQGNVIFTGAAKTTAPGTLPVSGEGTRMIWYPDKAAIRAGYTSSSQWDESNIGFFSTAFGRSTKASGSYSTSLGESTTASGTHSITGGYQTTASGDFAIAGGYNVSASGKFSMAIGYDLTAPSYGEIVIGSYNTSYTPASATSWSESDRLFVIGNGSSSARRNAVTVLKNGNTGFGTDNPSQKLHVKGSAAGNAVLLIEPNKWTSAGDYGELRFGDANHYIRGEHTKGMTFNDANKFHFSGGNVGIGYDNPAARLDVSASQGPNIIIRDSDGGTGRPGIQFVNNYIHYISGDDSDNEIFGIYSGYGDTRTYAARLNIHGPATTNWGKYISLTHDGNHGRISTDAGYLVLEPAGNRVGVGTDAPTQSLDVNGTLRVRGMTTGSSAGTVYRTSDGILITGASDARLKENIEPLENSLDKILQLNGVTFSWKSDAESKRNIGFVAQDFEKVIPELVFTNSNDGYKGINYAEVSALIVEALKEQQQIIEAQKKRIDALENRLSNLEKTRGNRVEK